MVKGKAAPPHAVYKPSEVAKILRCDARTLYGMIGRGELKAIKLGRVIRIPAAELEALLARDTGAMPKRK